MHKRKRGGRTSKLSRPQIPLDPKPSGLSPENSFRLSDQEEPKKIVKSGDKHHLTKTIQRSIERLLVEMLKDVKPHLRIAAVIICASAISILVSILSSYDKHIKEYSIPLYVLLVIGPGIEIIEISLDIPIKKRLKKFIADFFTRSNPFF